MKARNKKTGEVVTSFSISQKYGTASYIDSTNVLHFSTPLDGEWEIIDESESVDWDAFRREAAKDILCSVVANPERIGHVEYGRKDYRQSEYVRFAIDCADELIRLLKENSNA